jgi:hypothetical protein
MSQDSRAFLQERRRGRPAAIDTPAQQLVGVRPMIPDGDRRQFSESGHAEDENVRRFRKRNHQVVTKLILRDHIELGKWISVAC